MYIYIVAHAFIHSHSVRHQIPNKLSLCAPRILISSLSLSLSTNRFSASRFLSLFFYILLSQRCGGEEREIEESTLMLIKNGNQFICIDFFTAIPFRFAPVWLHK